MTQNAALFSLDRREIRTLHRLASTLKTIRSLQDLLAWDEETCLPASGTSIRSSQSAYLATCYHDLVTSKTFRKATDDAKRFLERNAETYAHVFDAKMVWRCDREIQLATAVPKSLAEALSRAKTYGSERWREAKSAANFSLMENALAEVLALSIERADCIGYTNDRYDLFLDEYDPGSTTAYVDAKFGELRRIVLNILEKTRDTRIRIEPLTRVFKAHPSEESLRVFQNEILSAMGFDFRRGRLDTSAHPFTAHPGVDDVRITSRFKEGEFMESISSAMHEGGHGLFEQGIDPAIGTTILGAVASATLHESQSRLWEMGIGTSASFWRHWYPKLLSRCGTTDHTHILKDTSCEHFVKALSAVTLNLVRTISHEVPYNLHVIMRYEIERDLVNGRLEVRDLPLVWNMKIKEYLGLDVPNDAVGVLQDPHWPGGAFGYFPTYALGNMTMAQILCCMKKEFPDFDKRIEAGDLLFIQQWLREKIHRFGSFVSPEVLLRNLTGEGLNPKYLEEYFRDKYGPLYGF